MTILVGSQRGGAKDLALHLMKAENEHVEVHEIRGFVSGTVMGALNEAYAVSRATRCKRFMYSLSANPPPDQVVSTEDLVGFIDETEERLGLKGQPRVIVFHEKEGRRHAHCVWSRIDTDALKAVHISYDYKTLVQLSREIFMRKGWTMPEGLIDARNRDPRNFTLAEWQQAKRIGKDPRAIKAAMREAWAISDNKSSLIAALQERGFKLARGDRGRVVAIDSQLEIYSFQRWAKVKTKDVRARVGDESELPDLDTQRTKMREDMTGMLGRLKSNAERRANDAQARFEARRAALVSRQRAERKALSFAQANELKAANQKRQSRFRTGFKGIWDRLRGEHKRTQTLNEMEAAQQRSAHQRSKDTLVARHLHERKRVELYRLRHAEAARRIERGLEHDQRAYFPAPEP